MVLHGGSGALQQGCTPRGLVEPAMTQAVLTLVVGLAGVAGAWLYFRFGIWAPLLIGLPLIVIGWIANRVGQGKLARDPVGALPWLEAWVLFPAVLAALGAAAVLLLTIELTPEKTTPSPTKELITQAVTLLTAFIVAVIVKQMDDADKLVSGHIKGVFNRMLEPKIPQNNAEARRALQAPQFSQDAEGWGWEARRVRAKVLARALAPP